MTKIKKEMSETNDKIKKARVAVQKKNSKISDKEISEEKISSSIWKKRF